MELTDTISAEGGDLIASDFSDGEDYKSDSNSQASMTSSEKLEIECYTESANWFDRDKYYGTYIGAVLAKRYRIEHKLGFGGFSTVWMAHDIQEKTDVALKILVAGEPGEREYFAQNKIISCVTSIPA
jgi:hypothetical protein